MRRLFEIPAFRNLLGLHSPSRSMLGACRCRRCRPYRFDAAKVMREGFEAGTQSVRPGLQAAIEAHLRGDRYCPVHGIDLVPPGRTLHTRRYCPKCPEGSTLGFPSDEQMDLRAGEQ